MKKKHSIFSAVLFWLYLSHHTDIIQRIHNYKANLCFQDNGIFVLWGAFLNHHTEILHIHLSECHKRTRLGINLNKCKQLFLKLSAFKFDMCGVVLRQTTLITLTWQLFIIQIGRLKPEVDISKSVTKLLLRDHWIAQIFGDHSRDVWCVWSKFTVAPQTTSLSLHFVY